MNKLIIIYLLLIPPFLFAAKVTPEEKQKKKELTELKRLVSKSKEKDLVSELRNFIYQTRPNRTPGNIGHEQAKKYIQDEVLKASPDNPVRLQLFKPQFELMKQHYQEEFKTKIAAKFSPKDLDFKNWSKFINQLADVEKHFAQTIGTNLIWEKKGKSSEKLLVIGVNYDSISFDQKAFKFELKKEAVAPGADDNGTGVILALNMIKFLASRELAHDVQVIFFDYQEFYALGSHAYVEELRAQSRLEKVYAFVNLLMLGHDTKKEDKEKKNFNYGFYLRDQSTSPSMRQFIDELSRLGKSFSTQIRFREIVYDIGPGDTTPFHLSGIPTLVVSQNHELDLNPRQHGANDFVETLNHKTFYESYKFLIGGISAFLLGL
jgi:Zn-dependent M28 family amino/carboxypeptidase